MAIDTSQLDQWFPPRGPCAFCGFHDARHRLWDVLVLMDETAEAQAANYELPVEAVRAVRAIWNPSAVDDEIGPPDEEDLLREAAAEIWDEAEGKDEVF